MKNFILTLIVICVFVGIQGPVLADGDPIKGKVIFETCANCHGVNGEGLKVTNAPRLTELFDSYLLVQLDKFQNGLRGGNAADTFGSQMASIAKSLPDKQSIQDVVTYISSLNSARPPRTEMSGDPVKGAKEYESCAGCHGLKAQSFKSFGTQEIGFEIPKLAGQHDWYLIRQTENFRKGIRGDLKDNTGGMQMRARTKVLIRDSQMIKDIVAYIGTLE